jgi:hypothetical protein
MIAALAPDDDGNFMPEVSEKQRRRLSRQAGPLFADAVAAMCLFWRRQGVVPSALPEPVGRTVRSAWLARRRDEVKATIAERSARKVGRNDPCPCGSGKKYKRCCGA